MIHLTQLYRAVNEETNIVILPTGCCVGLPAKDFEENVKRDIKLLKTDNVSVYLPDDKNIYRNGFAFVNNVNITHSPQKRALMLHEAITGKNADGSFKYKNIFITGGFDTDQVIIELEKIVANSGKPLPYRKDNLKIYGFSDASQLHHYLGQRGVATPVYYSAHSSTLVKQISNHKPIQPFELTAVNDVACALDELKGITLPGSNAGVEDKLTHQTALFDDENNMLVIEFRACGNDETDALKLKGFVDAFVQTTSKFDKPFSLILSKDTDQEACNLLKAAFEGRGVPIFFGALVGHGKCQKEDAAGFIPLFADAVIHKENGRYIMQINDKASDKVANLKHNSKRQPEPVAVKEPLTQDVYVTGDNGSAGVVIDNLEHIKQAADRYTVHLPPVNPLQLIKMTMEKMIEKGIMNTEQLKQLDVKSDYVLNDDDLKNAKKYLSDVSRRYFKDFKGVCYNGHFITENTGQGLSSLAVRTLQTYKGGR